MRVNMRYQSEVSTVASFEEDGHDSNESNHLIQVLGVHLSNNNTQDTRHDSNKVDPEFLSPKATPGDFVDVVSNYATKRTCDDV